jgi:hypothetical protein
MKSAIKDGHFTAEAETVFCTYHPQHCSEVTEKYHKVLPPHALQPLRVRLKSVSNEGHITLEAETHFRPYLPYDCSGVTV